MTRRRMRDNDYADYSTTRKAAEIALQKLHAGLELTDREQALVAALPEPGQTRARPVQHEAAEARHLAVEAYRRWWWPGFRRVEHPVRPMGASAQGAEKLVLEGARSGCPDFELWIPAGELIPGNRLSDTRGAVVCALELKAPSLKPRREVAPNWWLDPCDGRTHYGLAPEQRHWLRTMAGCGARTMVAFSGADAIAWLDTQAGPRPEVMPW